MKSIIKYPHTAAAEKEAQLPVKNRGEAFPEEYLAPEVNICAFAPESGFALSVRTESLHIGFRKGENVDEEYDFSSGVNEDFYFYYF